MDTVTLERAAGLLEELAQRVEAGETIVVTRDGRPVLDLVPHRLQLRGGFDPEAGEAYLRAAGIKRTAPFIPENFDDPLPEDFLIRPLPEQ